MTKDLISVVLPLHKSSPYIFEAIVSVKEQTYLNWELLIVLDRPSEEELINAEDYKKIDKKIIVLQSPGSGISDALNFGIARAGGNYIARLDSDDVMDRKRLEIQVSHFQRNPELVCIGSQMTVIDAAGKSLKTTRYPSEALEIRSLLRIRNVLGHPSVMYRKISVVRAGGYRSQFNGAEDYDLWIRLSKIGSVVNIEKPLTKYRVHDKQYSHKNRAHQLKLENEIRKANSSEWNSKSQNLSAMYINRLIHGSRITRPINLLLAFVSDPKTLYIFFKYIVLRRILVAKK